MSRTTTLVGSIAGSAKVATIATMFGAALCVQSGCSSTSAPIVSVESMTSAVQEQGDAISYLEVVAENPNATELPILNVSYSVTSGGRTYSGQRVGQSTLSRYGQQRLRLPVVMNVLPGEQAEVRGTIEYLKTSTIARTLHENGAGGSTIEFSGRVAGK